MLGRERRGGEATSSGGCEGTGSPLGVRRGARGKGWACIFMGKETKGLELENWKEAKCFVQLPPFYR